MAIVRTAHFLTPVQLPPKPEVGRRASRKVAAIKKEMVGVQQQREIEGGTLKAQISLPTYLPFPSSIPSILLLLLLLLLVLLVLLLLLLLLLHN